MGRQYVGDCEGRCVMEGRVSEGETWECSMVAYIVCVCVCARARARVCMCTINLDRFEVLAGYHGLHSTERETHTTAERETHTQTHTQTNAHARVQTKHTHRDTYTSWPVS